MKRLFFFLSFSLLLSQFIVIVHPHPSESFSIERNLFVSSCNEGQQHPIKSRFNFSQCIFLGNHSVKFHLVPNPHAYGGSSFLVNETIWADDDCNNINLANNVLSLEDMGSMCRFYGKFGYYNLFYNYTLVNDSRALEENKIDLSHEEFYILNHYKGKKCKGDVQYFSYVETPTSFFSNVMDFEFEEYIVTYHCQEYMGRIWPMRKLNQWDGKEMEWILNEGCDLDRTYESSHGEIEMSVTCMCGKKNKMYIAPNNRVGGDDGNNNNSTHALFPLCLLQENCTEENFDFAFLFEFDKCEYDNVVDQYYKYVKCNSEYGILGKVFYTGPFCEGEVDYYGHEYPFVSFSKSEKKKTLFCDMPPDQFREGSNLELQSFFDDKCEIKGDRIVYFPVSEECKEMELNYMGISNVKFGLNRSCNETHSFYMSVRFGDCDVEKEVLFELKSEILGCAKLPDFLLDFEGRFPYFQTLNLEFCRQCNGIHHYMSDVCNERGECYEQDSCNCEPEYDGKWCQDTTSLRRFKDFFINYWWTFILGFSITSSIIIFSVLLVILIQVVVKVSNRRKIQVLFAPKDEKEEVALMFTDIQSSSKLHQADAEVMMESVRKHNSLIRDLISKYSCYEVKTIGDAFMIATKRDKLVDLVKLSLEIQNELPKINYPTKFLYLPDTKPENNSSGEVIFRGLRVRIGIHAGMTNVCYDKKRNSYDYFGQTVNFCSRIESSAPGGCIFISTKVYNEVKYEIFEDIGGGVFFQDIGGWTLKGMKEKRKLYCVYQKERKYHGKIEEIEFKIEEKESILEKKQINSSSSSEEMEESSDSD